MSNDPVCGREIDERQAAAVVRYRLGTYYFCSESCHKVFSANLSRYVANQVAAGAILGEIGRVHSGDVHEEYRYAN